MKTFRPAPPVFRALFALLLLAACSSVPAQAQASGWQFDHFECTGSTQWTPGSTTQTFPWPASQAGSPEIQFGLNQYGAPCQSVGTICAVFAWQGSGQPSDSLPVLIFSSAGMYGTPPQPDPDDGFQDPLIPSGTPASKTSSGWHVVKLPNSGGSTTLKTDVYSLSAICGPSDDAAGSGTYIDFQVHIADPSLEGHSTADTAGWDPTNPRFFSGTACTAKGVAAALSGNVSHAQLCIGENGSDTVVNEYFDQSASGVPGAASVPLNAMFDSTHFKDQAKIKLTLKVWDTNGVYYEVNVTGPAYNKAYVLQNGRPEFEPEQNIPDFVNLRLQDCNYTSHPSSTLQRADILNLIPSLTVMHIGSHGFPGIIGDCVAAPGTNTTPPDMSHYLEAGSFSPGFTDVPLKIIDQTNAKGSVYPPYNFVFVDGCLTGSTSDLSDAFLGWRATPGGPYSGVRLDRTDRAYLGWLQSIWLDDELGRWTEHMWASLSGGLTLRDAVINASILDHPTVGGPDDSTGKDGKPIPDEGDPLAVPVVQGDSAMRLQGVYGSAYDARVPMLGQQKWFMAK